MEPRRGDPGTFFYDIDEADRDALAAIGTRRRYPAGAALFLAGDTVHEALVIMTGLLKAEIVSAEGRLVILDLMGPGALVGEMAALDGGVRSATIRAQTDLEVLTINTAAFNQFLLDHPAVLHRIALMLAKRLRDSGQRQLQLGAGDSLSRLCARILLMVERFGDPEGSEPHVDCPLNQSELAAWCGLSREAVVKQLRTMRRLGWLETDGRRMTLTDINAVRSRAFT